MLRPVKDFNEVSYHLLEATAVHLYFVRGPPETIGANGAVKSEGGGLFVDQNGGGAATTGSSRALSLRISPTARKVYEFLKNSPQNNEGLHVHNIAQGLQLPASEIFKAGDELLAEGAIYTTIDDETWAMLEM